MISRKYTIIYFAITLFVGVLVACSGESEEGKSAKTPDIVVDAGEDTTRRELGFFDRTKNPYDNRTLNQYNVVKKKGKFVTHFCPTYNGTLFLMQSKEDVFKSDGNYDKTVKYALLDVTGKFLLPLEYEQISNPGFIADDIVEIKKNGKYGLYNYALKKIIEPEYDLIFPSKIMEYLAIGEKDGQLFKIYPDGTKKAFKEGQPAPNYVRLLNDYRLNYKSDFFGFWFPVSAFQYMDDEYRPGMIITPSYIAQLDIYPDLVREINTNGDTLNISASSSTSRNSEVTSFFADFFNTISESRGYTNQKRYVVTVDKTNRKKSNIELYNYSDNYLYARDNDEESAKNAFPTAKFINDSTIEVKNFIQDDKLLFSFDEEETESTEILPYGIYTRYEYYSIDINGKISYLSKGLFPITSCIELQPYHFKGFFMQTDIDNRIKQTENYNSEYDDYPSAYIITDHLSLSDLTYMRNEIYARHGLKFKDPAIAEQFLKFDWYRGTRKNVDKLLTPIEKKNIQIIKNLESKLKVNPGQFIHEEFKYYVAAG